MAWLYFYPLRNVKCCLLSQMEEQQISNTSIYLYQQRFFPPSLLCCNGREQEI